MLLGTQAKLSHRIVEAISSHLPSFSPPQRCISCGVAQGSFPLFLLRQSITSNHCRASHIRHAVSQMQSLLPIPPAHKHCSYLDKHRKAAAATSWENGLADTAEVKGREIISIKLLEVGFGLKDNLWKYLHQLKLNLLCDHLRFHPTKAVFAIYLKKLPMCKISLYLCTLVLNATALLITVIQL